MSEKDYKIEASGGFDGGSTSTQKRTQTYPNDVEITFGKNGRKYLYETGLQNIFNDYNKQIANLDASKQKEIEDAYYVRELSKKYLGEYASNIGVGDVSGQLLDIYGKYQSNMNEINANFNGLQTGLESSYNEKKNEYKLGLLQTQMDIEKAEQQEQLEKELAEINYNIALELYPEGMDAQDYLDSVRDKIGESNYWSEMAKNKLVEMNDTTKGALNNTNKYKNQGEWDIYVDSLLSNKSIGKQQADYLKGIYETEQSTNFILDNSINTTSDISYFNSDEDIISKGNVYVSRNGNTILAETKNIVDSSSKLFERINKDYQTYDEKGNFVGDMGLGVPFGSVNKWYVSTIKDGEQVFVEYKISTNYNKITNFQKITKEDSNYNLIDEKLKGESGYIDSGSENIAFIYNEEDDSYTQYLNYKAFNVGGEEGDFVIGSNKYSIGEKLEDLINNWDFGDNPKWESGYNNSNVKEIVSKFVDIYFNGDSEKFGKYLETTRGFLWGNKVGSDADSKVKSIVVKHNNKYYTINDGELYELSKKQGE